MDWLGNAFWIGVAIVLVLFVVASLSSATTKLNAEQAQIKRYSGVLQPLVTYAGQYDSGLTKYVRNLRATGEDCDHVTVDTVLMSDIAALVRAVALPKDEIRLTDAEMLQVFCWKRKMASEFDRISPFDLLKAIEQARPPKGFKGFAVLLALHAQDSPEAPELTKIYLDLAKAIAQEPEGAAANRAVGLKQLEREFKSSFRSGPVQSVNEVMREAAQNLAENSEAMLRELETEEDPRCELLGIDEDATLEDLRAAYHSKIALWHPDRLNGMAPELQQAANEQVARLNEAYRSLCAEWQE